MAQHGVDALLFEPGHKLVLVISALQHGKNGAFRHVGEFPVLNLLLGTCELLLHGFIANGLPEKRGLERVAYLVALVVRDGIDQPVILPSAHVAPRFLHRQVIEGKERTVFTHRLKAVLPVQSLHGVAHLFLHIASRCVHLTQGRVKAAASALRIVQPIFLFKLTGDLLAAVVVVLVADTFSVLVHPHGNDVQVVAVYVLVLENKVRLVAEAHLFQILAGYILQFHIGQHILRVRVERDMHHRFLHHHLRRQEG